MIVALPIVQLLVLPLAADFEVRHISLAVVNEDHSSYAQQLVDKIVATGYFQLVDMSTSYRKADLLMEEDKADIILDIPAGFEQNLVREGSEHVYLAANAINGVKAGLGSSYLVQIIGEFNRDIQLKWMPYSAEHAPPQLEVTSTAWFNPYMDYRLFMVPGILAVLVTMIGGYMSALNIVKEKEIGTIEQINVTPIRKHQFILGKLLPFWILGLFVFSLGLFGVSTIAYGIWPRGSIFALYVFLSIYLVAILGFGLLISTYCETQQQAMSVAFFFMLVFLLMCGLFTPVESMPGWARILAHCNPVTYFVQVMRMIVLKGSGFADIWRQLLIVLAMGVGLNSWAVLNYRKSS